MCTSRSATPCSRRPSSDELAVDVFLFRDDTLLDLQDLGPATGDLVLDFGAHPDRGLSGLDLRLPAKRVCLALSLAFQRLGLALGLPPDRVRLTLRVGDEQLAGAASAVEA